MTQNIMSVVLFGQLLVCATVLAFSLYVLETDDSLFRIMVAMYSLLGYIGLTFAFCLISDMVTTSLDHIGEIFYQRSWYLLPTKQRQLFVLSIQQSQREFHFNGYGFVDCSLITFSRVIMVILSILFEYILLSICFWSLFVNYSDCVLLFFGHFWSELKKLRLGVCIYHSRTTAFHWLATDRVNKHEVSMEIFV